MRSTRRYRHYDHVFKQDTLALLDRSDKSIEELAASLGMPAGTLYKWSHDHMAKKA